MNIFIKVTQLNSVYLMAAIKELCFSSATLHNEMRDFTNMYDGCAFE